MGFLKQDTPVIDFAEYGEMYEPMRALLSSSLRGPHVNFAARMSTPGGHGTENGWGDFITLTASTPQEGRVRVRAALAGHPDLIKIFTDGWRYGTSADLTSMNVETLRAMVEEFRHPDDSRLSLVGAFGYDLLFQFDPIELKLPRQGVKDLQLFLCDDIYFMDRKKETIERYQFDFTRGNDTTVGKPRTAAKVSPEGEAPATEVAARAAPAPAARASTSGQQRPRRCIQPIRP